mgnify:FL=1
MANSHNGNPFFTSMSQYVQFLDMFGAEHSFQTFDDKVYNKKIIKQLHGTIREHFFTLAQLNKKGAGVFFTVNETDLLGRTARHITKVRAVFIDLDGTPLPTKFELQPHLIVNTSPNKYHCYWLVSDMPLESFTLYQQALAKKYQSDEKVKDLPRIMRIAGFWHNKKNPYPVKIVSLHKAKPYTKNEIKTKLSLQRPQKNIINYTAGKSTWTGNGTYGASEGDRHEKLVRMLVAIRLRGESYEYAKQEALQFASACSPPERESEVMFQLNDIWRRYDPVKTLSINSNR